jgi:hypothetical protein
MTRKEKREMDRLRALVVEANVQRDKAWEAYKEMLYRVVDAETRLKRIKEELEDG